MSVRRKDPLNGRWVLYRQCGTCGKWIMTTADSPWVRQVERDGKKQATTYYCSSKCFQASYKHIGWYDGKADIRREEREKKRDISEKNRRYYQKHKEKERQRSRDRYWSDPEAARAANAYSRKKRKLLEATANAS